MCQQTEIRSLKAVIHDLRGSLQISDAQNLALQVMLKRMNKAECDLPVAEKGEVRTKIQKSEKQLENLITELKEMSQTKYPTLSSQNYSSSSSSTRGTQERGQEQELGQTQEYLTKVQQELQDMASRLRPSPSLVSRDLSLAEAHSALLEAQGEVERMRSSLEAALAALEASEGCLRTKEQELGEARSGLSEAGRRLRDSENSVAQLRQNRSGGGIVINLTTRNIFQEKSDDGAKVCKICPHF